MAGVLQYCRAGVGVGIAVGGSVAGQQHWCPWVNLVNTMCLQVVSY